MYKSHKGWYKLNNPSKFIRPLDEYMDSTKVINEGTFVQYKSGLERIAFCYADLNPKIKYFSVEPFNIPYIKPLDNKIHRYFIDMFLEFTSGDKFIVEIKSHHETLPPEKPKVNTSRALIRYKNALETYLTNQAKWKSAKEFAESKGMKFIILTEKELRR